MNTLTYSKICVAVNDSGRAIGEDHVRAKYLDEDVEAAKRLRIEGFSFGQISKMLEIPIRTIRGYIDGSRRNESVADYRTIKRKIR